MTGGDEVKEASMADQRGVKVQGLVHWALSVNDLQESRRFYTELLGMEDEGSVGPTMWCVRFGDIPVLLCKRSEPAPTDGPRESPAQSGSPFSAA